MRVETSDRNRAFKVANNSCGNFDAGIFSKGDFYWEEPTPQACQHDFGTVDHREQVLVVYRFSQTFSAESQVIVGYERQIEHLLDGNFR